MIKIENQGSTEIIVTVEYEEIETHSVPAGAFINLKEGFKNIGILQLSE
jgi:hypothetical protein